MRRRQDIECRCRHAEWIKQPLPHDIAIVASRDLRDHSAEKGVADVGVLELQAGRPTERESGGHKRIEIREWQRLLAIPPRIISGETARHREQVRDAQGRCRRRESY